MVGEAEKRNFWWWEICLFKVNRKQQIGQKIKNINNKEFKRGSNLDDYLLLLLEKKFLKEF